MANKIKVNYQHDEEEYNEQFLRNFEYNGEEIFACDTCETEISEEEYKRNDGRCDECNADIYEP
jgi:formylmethanofuran dehydrogenase subunit E